MKSSKGGEGIILTKQEEYQNLTQIMPFIEPYRHERCHFRKLMH